METRQQCPCHVDREPGWSSDIPENDWKCRNLHLKLALTASRNILGWANAKNRWLMAGPPQVHQAEQISRDRASIVGKPLAIAALLRLFNVFTGSACEVTALRVDAMWSLQQSQHFYTPSVRREKLSLGKASSHSFSTRLSTNSSSFSYKIARSQCKSKSVDPNSRKISAKRQGSEQTCISLLFEKNNHLIPTILLGDNGLHSPSDLGESIL